MSLGPVPTKIFYLLSPYGFFFLITFLTTMSVSGCSVLGSKKAIIVSLIILNMGYIFVLSGYLYASVCPNRAK